MALAFDAAGKPQKIVAPAGLPMLKFLEGELFANDSAVNLHFFWFHQFSFFCADYLNNQGNDERSGMIHANRAYSSAGVRRTLTNGPQFH